MTRYLRLALAAVVVGSCSLGVLAGCGKQTPPENNPHMSAQERADRLDKKGE